MRPLIVAAATLLAVGCVGQRLISGAVGPRSNSGAATAASASAQDAPTAMVLGENALVRLTVADPALYEAADGVFGVHFRVQNRTDQDVRFDVSSADFVHPTQFGPLPEGAPRGTVDERRLSYAPISAREVPVSRAGALPIVARGRTVDVFVPFRDRTHPPDIFATPQMYVSLDGVVDAQAQDGREMRLSLAWRDGVGPAETDLVLQTSRIGRLRPPACDGETREIPRGSEEPPIVLCGARW